MRNYELARSFVHTPFDKGPFYHGTRADMKTGDLLTPGGKSNYKTDLVMNHIYFTALPNGAGLAAALAKGDGNERVYIVEPTGNFENDPNVTDKKFPGNPSRSYRTAFPLKIVGELHDWVKQTPEDIQKWREKLANSKGDIIN
ncbi:MAG: NAD(+)--rifampin ADP-ribosyltransferase [Bacteroidia bacterium]